jgi:hypothetical protein
MQIEICFKRYEVMNSFMKIYKVEKLNVSEMVKLVATMLAVKEIN